MRAIHLLFAAALVALPLEALANHIDFIEDGAFSAQVNPISQSSSSNQVGDPANIIGSERRVVLQGGATGAAQISTFPSATDSTQVDSLQAVAATTTFISGSLIYDGPGSAGLGAVDFDTLWNSIAVDVSSVVFDLLVTITVRDAADHVGSMSQTIGAAGAYFFPFTDPGYTGVDFFSVDAVTVGFAALQPGAAIGISQITREVEGGQTGPEPSALALVLFALSGLALVRREGARAY